MDNEILAKAAAEKIDNDTVRGSPIFAEYAAHTISSTYAPVFDTMREMRDALIFAHPPNRELEEQINDAITSANKFLEPTNAN